MSHVHDSENTKKLTELFVVVSIDEKGNEGIVAGKMGGQWFPIVTSDEALAQLILLRAKNIEQETKKNVVLVRFERANCRKYNEKKKIKKR